MLFIIDLLAITARDWIIAGVLLFVLNKFKLGWPLRPTVLLACSGSAIINLTLWSLMQATPLPIEFVGQGLVLWMMLDTAKAVPRREGKQTP
jgi:hypothetical protein